VENYRDAIQFLWDQTVRAANNGLTTDEIAATVQLPERYHESPLTRQIYGLVEHHVRQIHAGLFGWFDEDPSHLFPLGRADRAARMIDGFGGRDAVTAQCDQALAAADWRWAIELAGWLVVTAPTDDTADRERLAAGLRGIAQHTTSQNIRNWCLTKALELEGSIDTRRFYGLRLRPAEIEAMEPATSVALLRVLLDPDRAEGNDRHLGFRFDDGTTCGLHVRRSVAVPTDGSNADLAIALDRGTWAQLVGGRLALSDALADGRIDIDTGTADQIRSFFAQFELETLAG